MSPPFLGEFDRLLGAVEHRTPGVVLLAWRYCALAQHSPVTLVIVTDEAGREVIAAAVPLAPPRVNPQFHQTFPLSTGV
jgi:hypothetical protein